MGEAAEIIVDLSESGIAHVTAKVMAPSGDTGDIEFKPESKGSKVYRSTYIPKKSGDYIVEVKFQGQRIPDSPYRVPILAVLEPRYVKCSGDGLTHAIANEKAEFEVDTTKAGPGILGLAIEGPAEVMDIKYEPGDENGKFNVSYTVPLPGVYKITVKYNDEVVPGAPFEVTVEKVISKVKVSSSGITGKGARVGEPAKIIVDCSESPSGDTGVIKFEAITEGSIVYKGAYIPKEPGYYGVEVKFDGEPIPKRPYQVPICNPYAVHLDGDGLKLAVVDEDNVIDVYISKAGPGHVTVEFIAPIGSPPIKPILMKVGDNHIQVHFAPKCSGVYKVKVVFSGFMVENKPREIPTIDLSKVFVTGPGIQSGNPAKAETYFDVDALHQC